MGPILYFDTDDCFANMELGESMLTGWSQLEAISVKT